MKQKSRAIYVLFEVKRHTAGGFRERTAGCMFIRPYPAARGGIKVLLNINGITGLRCCTLFHAEGYYAGFGKSFKAVRIKNQQIQFHILDLGDVVLFQVGGENIDGVDGYFPGIDLSREISLHHHVVDGHIFTLDNYIAFGGIFHENLYCGSEEGIFVHILSQNADAVFVIEFFSLIQSGLFDCAGSAGLQFYIFYSKKRVVAVTAADMESRVTAMFSLLLFSTFTFIPCPQRESSTYSRAVTQARFNQSCIPVTAAPFASVTTVPEPIAKISRYPKMAGII